MSLVAACLLSLLAAAPTSQPSPTIVWDASTLHLVAEHGSYARVIVLPSRDWLAGFSRGGSVWSSRSADRGVTWSPPVQVGGYVKGGATNAELIALADGRVMFLFNEREHAAGVRQDAGQKGREPDNGIAIAFSSDGGKTWSPSKRIYGGGAMWEPAAIEVTRDAKTELQVFFADEKPFGGKGPQQISRKASTDGGVTWTKPIAVSYRNRHRDGMPVPLKLADGRIVIAIEDDGLGGTFKPTIVDVTTGPTPVGGTSASRWGALADPLPAEVYAGAPYLVTVDKETTVLSAQVAPPGKPRRMVVWVGDGQAKHFVNATSPFDQPGDAAQEWNALTSLGDDRLLAISGTRIDGKAGIWAIEGRLTH